MTVQHPVLQTSQSLHCWRLTSLRQIAILNSAMAIKIKLQLSEFANRHEFYCQVSVLTANFIDLSGQIPQYCFHSSNLYVLPQCTLVWRHSDLFCSSGLESPMTLHLVQRVCQHPELSGPVKIAEAASQLFSRDKLWVELQTCALSTSAAPNTVIVHGFWAP